MSCDPWRRLNTDISLQKTDAYRRITGRVILQPNVTRSHYHYKYNKTIVTSVQHDRQLIQREQIPWPNTQLPLKYLDLNTHQPTATTETSNTQILTTTATITYIKDAVCKISCSDCQAPYIVEADRNKWSKEFVFEEITWTSSPLISSALRYNPGASSWGFTEIQASEGGQAVNSTYWLYSARSGENILAYTDMKNGG